MNFDAAINELALGVGDALGAQGYAVTIEVGPQPQLQIGIGSVAIASITLEPESISGEASALVSYEAALVAPDHTTAVRMVSVVLQFIETASLHYSILTRSATVELEAPAESESSIATAAISFDAQMKE